MVFYDIQLITILILTSSLCCLSKLETMASIISLVTTGEGVVGMLVDSVEGEMFSLDLDSLFVEGYIMSNKVNAIVG